MTDTDLVWIADRNLQITTLSARLRDLLFPSGTPSRLHVSELWQDDDPFGMMLLAHQWVLEGERMEFDTERCDMPLRISIEPMFDLSGAIAGVGGRATPGVGGRQSRYEERGLEEAERICGFGTWRKDLKTGKTTWSPGLYEILGIAQESEPPDDLRVFDHPQDAAAVSDTIRDAEVAGGGYRCDHRIVRADGTTRYVQEQGHTIYDDRDRACAQAGGVIDITDRKAAEVRLAELAHYDPVSKLPNRTLLEQRLHSSLSRSRSEGTGCAVLFIDVDDFKRINDTFGHAAGDELLAAIGARLNHHVRASDTVARMSGDEFVVVLDGVTSREDAMEAAHKILRSFEMPFHLEGARDCRVGVSIGVAIHSENSVSAKALIDTADREMYAVKRNGGRGIKLASTQECAPAACETPGCATSSAARYPLLIAANA